MRRASATGVELLPLSICLVDGPARLGLILGYGAIPAEWVYEGLRRLRHCSPD